MRILAIDPGNALTAYCLMDEQYDVHDKGKILNRQMLDYIHLNTGKIDHLVVEMIASMGMAVGKDVFETCVMIGMIERTADLRGIAHSRVYRREEKIGICGDSKAKDANIRRALIDRFAKHDLLNGKGTKKEPDHFYGFARDMWSAFAVGVVWLDKMTGGGADGQRNKGAAAAHAQAGRRGAHPRRKLD